MTPAEIAAIDRDGDGELMGKRWTARRHLRRYVQAEIEHALDGRGRA